MTEDTGGTANKKVGGKGGNNRNRNRRGRNNKKGNNNAGESKVTPTSGEAKQPPQPQKQSSTPAASSTTNNATAPTKKGKGGRGGRRARRGRNANKQQQRIRGPPTAPQIKINLRNITSTEHYGSMKALLTQLLQPLIETTNANLETKLFLEPGAIDTLIHHEQLIQQARLEWENRDKENTSTNTNENDHDATTMNKEGSTMAGDQKEPPSSDYLTAAAANIPTEGTEQTEPPSQPYIALRILQAIPPRITKRRGEQPGNIYLVWMAPPIEAKEIQSSSTANSLAGGAVSSIQSGENKEETGDVASVASKTNTTAAAFNNSTQEGTTNEAASETGDNKANVPKNNNNNNKQNKAPQRIDYSREVAQRRLWLLKALEAAQQALQSHPTFGACQIAEALNIKTFKPNSSTGQKLEGTIFESKDYLDFVQRQETAEQELKARPRPVPGGADHTNPTAATEQHAQTSSSSAAPSSNSTAPVPAIVLHLQAKKQEKARKTAKKQAQRKKGGGDAKPVNEDTENKQQQQPKKKKQGGRKGRGKKKAGTAAATN